MHIDIVGNQLFSGEEFSKSIIVAAVVGGEDAEIEVSEAERGIDLDRFFEKGAASAY